MWQLTSVSIYDEPRIQQLETFLRDGWEPFSVTNEPNQGRDKVWLRREASSGSPKLYNPYFPKVD